MNVLAIDPSSRCTGYAVLTGLGRDDLVDAGRLRPSEAAAEIDGPAWWRVWMAQVPLRAYRRMYSMIPDLRDLIVEHRPDWTVVEVPSGLAGSGSRHGAKASLTTYGAAAGLVLGACGWFARADRVVPVTERMWIRNSIREKSARQRAVARLYVGRYRSLADGGADAADAIALARWWLLFGVKVVTQ